MSTHNCTPTCWAEGCTDDDDGGSGECLCCRRMIDVPAGFEETTLCNECAHNVIDEIDSETIAIAIAKVQARR